MQTARPSFAPQILPLGMDALVVRFSLTPDPGANAAAQVFARALEEALPPGVVEIVPSLASVMVRFDPQATTRAELSRVLGRALAGRDWHRVAPPPATRRWVIPATFGGRFGPQLAEAAHAAGITEAQARADLAAARLRVLAIGFAPGQPYLGLLPDAWDFPRLGALTPQVPAGALVVALRQVVLFANPSATGWRHVGQTAFRPFRPEAAEPFPLRVGDEVQFDPVPEAEFATFLQNGRDTARLERL